MKKYILYIISISLLLLCLTGCRSTSTANIDTQSVQEKLVNQPYSTEILGYDINLTLNPDGTATASTEDLSYNFTYSLSDVEDNTATITVNGTGIADIDGKSAQIEFVNDDLKDLKISYQGMSYVLKPVSE